MPRAGLHPRVALPRNGRKSGAPEPRGSAHVSQVVPRTSALPKATSGGPLETRPRGNVRGAVSVPPCPRPRLPARGLDTAPPTLPHVERQKAARDARTPGTPWPPIRRRGGSIACGRRPPRRRSRSACGRCSTPSSSPRWRAPPGGPWCWPRRLGEDPHDRGHARAPGGERDGRRADRCWSPSRAGPPARWSTRARPDGGLRPVGGRGGHLPRGLPAPAARYGPLVGLRRRSRCSTPRTRPTSSPWPGTRCWPAGSSGPALPRPAAYRGLAGLAAESGPPAGRGRGRAEPAPGRPRSRTLAIVAGYEERKRAMAAVTTRTCWC